MRLVCVLSTFKNNTGRTDRRTDGPTDGHDLLLRCDGASKRMIILIAKRIIILSFSFHYFSCNTLPLFFKQLYTPCNDLYLIEHCNELYESETIILILKRKEHFCLCLCHYNYLTTSSPVVYSIVVGIMICMYLIWFDLILTDIYLYIPECVLSSYLNTNVLIVIFLLFNCFCYTLAPPFNCYWFINYRWWHLSQAYSLDVKPYHFVGFLRYFATFYASMAS